MPIKPALVLDPEVAPVEIVPPKPPAPITIVVFPMYIFDF
jgi:hypothetical protein